VEHGGRFYNFYNAKHMPDWIEQMGGATSANLLDWKRFDNNPIVRVRKGGYDEKFCSDGKVFRDGDHWVMLYFGVGRGGAHVMAAFSRDLATAINKVLDNPELAEAMAAAGQKRAREVFSWSSIAQQTKRLYDSLVK